MGRSKSGRLLFPLVLKKAEHLLSPDSSQLNEFYLPEPTVTMLWKLQWTEKTKAPAEIGRFSENLNWALPLVANTK
jgi:hypothetical protein